MAALTSRFSKVPQPTQVHSRSCKVSSLLILPQQEHILLLGSKRPIRKIFLPYHSALYSSMVTNVPQPASLIAPASLWFFTMPLIFKSSIAILSWFLIRSLEVLCKKSIRLFATLSCSFANLFLVRLPLFTEYLRCTYFNFESAFFRCFGLSNSAPSDDTTKDLIPKSIPTVVFSLIAFFDGIGVFVSQSMDAKYLPVGVLLIVACLIVPFISRCKIMSIPFLNFGILNLPSNNSTLAGTLKDCRDVFFLKFGKSFCPFKNVVKALSKLIIDCCNDWLLISFNHSHSFFNSGNCFTKSKHDRLTLLPTYAVCLVSKAKLYTNRQLPICLLISSACAFVGDIRYLNAFNIFNTKILLIL